MVEFTPPPNCADNNDPDSLSVDVARQRIASLLPVIQGWEKCALRDALNRVLQRPIISPVQVPPHTNSAMDGYAIRSGDIQTETFALLQVGIAYAGKPFIGKVKPGQCIRIMTGAVVPEDCDTIIMQEHAEVEADTIHVHGAHKTGQHVRLAGEDIEAGDEILPAGRQLTPADIGMIASLGIGEVMVKRTLRVAFFSTGDELRSIGEPLAPGQIYDSNRYTLFGMLKRLGIDVLDMGVVADKPEALKQALCTATQEADVIISSGGVSVGDADYVKAMLAELGQVDFWKIAMKPGRPLAFGKINNTLFFGLPGNPVSVMVTFYQFVQPALQQITGNTSAPLPLLQAITTCAIRKRLGRFEYQRGIVSANEQGQLQVQIAGQQGSGILHSMSQANCFILLDEQCDGVAKGESVTIQVFAGLV